uniref:Uncharacterized protein n=1 Tax=Anguilla anguilla TaxID=7936 RepID=A0A0E9SXL2_ANGAN
MFMNPLCTNHFSQSNILSQFSSTLSQQLFPHCLATKICGSFCLFLGQILLYLLSSGNSDPGRNLEYCTNFINTFL